MTKDKLHMSRVAIHVLPQLGFVSIRHKRLVGKVSIKI